MYRGNVGPDEGGGGGGGVRLIAIDVDWIKPKVV